MQRQHDIVISSTSFTIVLLRSMDASDDWGSLLQLNSQCGVWLQGGVLNYKQACDLILNFASKRPKPAGSEGWTADQGKPAVADEVRACGDRGGYQKTMANGRGRGQMGTGIDHCDSA